MNTIRSILILGVAVVGVMIVVGVVYLFYLLISWIFDDRCPRCHRFEMKKTDDSNTHKRCSHCGQMMAWDAERQQFVSTGEYLHLAR